MTAEGTFPKSDGDVLYGSEVNEFVPVGCILPWAKTFDSQDSGTTDGTTTDKLVQSGQNFQTTVEVGYCVHNTTDDTFAYVTAVDSDTTLSLDSDIMIAGEDYTIYATPALPSNFVECDGSVLSDADSVFDGATLPDLNAGTYRMLRGAISSGATGGADTHTLTTDEMPAHTHTYNHVNFSDSNEAGGSLASTNKASQTTSSTGGGSAHNNLPAYYSVVFIMKIK